MKEYKYLIFEESANTKIIDRVTGERKAEWARDPETGELLPRLDKNGNPRPKINKATGRQEDPRGFLARWFPSFASKLLHPHWLSFIGVIGLFIAFGHSILAMSGEETLAQVYREVESPKLPNFKKAAFIVFVYSLGLTATISFLAVALIPDEVRMRDYSENLIGGLAMYVWGHPYARLLLNAFVVVIGFLILAGAVNTAIIGSNGVLNRVAEDGVLPDWFLKPHSRYGTTYRLLYLIVGLQLFTILVSRGDMLILGEAYAFGVVWSFVFKSLSVLVLRYRDRTRRTWRVPLNLKLLKPGGVEFPLGLALIFLVLFATAMVNLFTKQVATVWGVGFTLALFVVFEISERQNGGVKHAYGEELERFNLELFEDENQVTPEALEVDGHAKLIAIRDPNNLVHLHRYLQEPDDAYLIALTVRVERGIKGLGLPSTESSRIFNAEEEKLFSKVVKVCEDHGRAVTPLVIVSNDQLYAIARTACQLKVDEVVMGVSGKFHADLQLEHFAMHWGSLSSERPIKVRVLSETLDIRADVA
jgi:hypothetical protein